MKKIFFTAMILSALTVTTAAFADVDDGCLDGRSARIYCVPGTVLSHDGCAGPEYMVKCNPRGPVTEPAAPVALEPTSLELVEVLAKNLPAFETFSKSGNKVISASVTRLSPTQTRYEVFSRTCFEGGINRGRCLGGARLLILKKVTPGNMPKTEFKSKVDFLR